MYKPLKTKMDTIYIVDGSVNYYKDKKIDQKSESQTVVSSFEILSELCLERLNRQYTIMGLTPTGILLDKYTPEGIKDRYDHRKNNYGHPVIILEETLKVKKENGEEFYTVEMIIKITEKILNKI
jgi:beta-glucosidase/6-phospho-beta-glucosidase/beta-galactosidase